MITMAIAILTFLGTSVSALPAGSSIIAPPSNGNDTLPWKPTHTHHPAHHTAHGPVPTFIAPPNGDGRGNDSLPWIPSNPTIPEPIVSEVKIEDGANDTLPWKPTHTHHAVHHTAHHTAHGPAPTFVAPPNGDGRGNDTLPWFPSNPDPVAQRAGSVRVISPNRGNCSLPGNAHEKKPLN